MDLSKLKLTDWLVGGGAIAYLLSMFLPWFSFGGISISGFNSGFLAWFPLLLILAVFAATVLPKLADGVKIPDPLGPLPLPQAALIGAGGAAALVLIRLLSAPFGFGRSFGLFLGILAAAAVTVGAVLKFQGKEEIGGIGSGGGGSQPPTTF